MDNKISECLKSMELDVMFDIIKSMPITNLIDDKEIIGSNFSYMNINTFKDCFIEGYDNVANLDAYRMYKVNNCF